MGKEALLVLGLSIDRLERIVVKPGEIVVKNVTIAKQICSALRVGSLEKAQVVLLNQGSCCVRVAVLKTRG